ncbi:bifunctional 3,4-dihydroxy-2-butanone-4-phosphate synthase/GTP cyclohydrolase II [Chromatium okenii]|jgi:3,4-dihydroxy 2-butanone 4-phosphate synthase/GTP cyclohydrolase II|uniref:bifunctional 3,4-dihydroxy-2-butanone-4-phosphate synthase/GTP cyclohydrolase II n=1 Tax=Chromatium okenii TaxID=61644 RepID=UPI0026ECB18B|nr:bifunctional 3,4-dihydroxy-2-butanone-4-phosphate synthase/GTP cyclohydrolase II [Chromatium okenii]MBV5308805.1 3,4-dihydroxy-2-butanone-4-phosphate synthase [Chromatium okenii]
MSSSGLNSIEDIIADLRLGRMVVIMDDEDRENEGDLLLAADCVTPEAVNFMAKYGRGLICLTLTKDRCERLRLPLMVSDNQAAHSTAFTVSIEAAQGVTTGISAADRAVTIRAAVAANASPKDLVQPGHIFPLMAQPGGVLVRAGHTEAGCDLARLAGFSPAAAIVEILNEDGSMARRPDLELFAQTHGLKIGTIADLIQYRVRHEKAVLRECVCELPTAEGVFQLIAYRDSIDNELHLALTLGEIRPDRPTLVRVHLQNTLCDLFETVHSTCGWPLRDVMRHIAAAGEGVIVVLRNRDRPADLLCRLKELQPHDDNAPTFTRPQDRNELRTYGIGAQILADLGVRKMRVMSAPKSMHAISGFDLEVVEYTGGRPT